MHGWLSNYLIGNGKGHLLAAHNHNFLLKVLCFLFVTITFMDIMGLTSSTCEVALIPRVPVTDLPTVGVAIEAGVAGVSRHPLAQATALLTRLPPLVAVGLRQAGAVAVGVVAGHRGCWGHA